MKIKTSLCCIVLLLSSKFLTLVISLSKLSVNAHVGPLENAEMVDTNIDDFFVKTPYEHLRVEMRMRI